MYALKNAPVSAMKYVAFYPIENFKNIISLEEGGTPLIHAKNLGKEQSLKYLYLKNEGMNPTGCFKDRGTLVEVTKAKEMGAKAICLASTGNMAASVAAYSSVAGIPCYVLVPEGTPIGKLSQTLTFGARVIQIRGDYSECAKLAEQMSKRFGYYLAGDYTFRTEGQKSEGYEIIEQLFWKSPDYVLCPIGCGTNFHAIYKGIKEFHKLGLTDKIPKLIGVQSPGCNPISLAVSQKNKDFEIQTHPNTIASAMCVGNPLDGKKILDDIYESGGTCIDVSDEEILEAQQDLSRNEGVFAEPSGAMSYGAVKKLQKDSFFKKDDVIVCMVNGNGLKDPKSPLKILPEPASVEPNFEEVEHFIENKLYALRESGQKEKSKLLFSSVPKSEKELSDIIQKEFGIEATPEITTPVFELIKNFIEKGKDLRKSDLQYILEEVLDEISLKEKVLEITNFNIQTSLHEKAEAKICAKIFKNELCFVSSGVGPVDAALSALQKGLINNDTLKVKLIDYEVEIDTRGIDATVEVKMTLKDKSGNKVVSRTTSPDIIVASIKAFEKGFNLLYSKK